MGRVSFTEVPFPSMEVVGKGGEGRGEGKGEGKGGEREGKEGEKEGKREGGKKGEKRGNCASNGAPLGRRGERQAREASAVVVPPWKSCISAQSSEARLSR